MKLPKLLDKLHRFFSRKLKHQEEKRKQLKVLLKKLKKEENALKANLRLVHRDLADAPAHVPASDPGAPLTEPPALAQLQRRLGVLHEQRKKGVALLRSLTR